MGILTPGFQSDWAWFLASSFIPWCRPYGWGPGTRYTNRYLMGSSRDWRPTLTETLESITLEAYADR